MNKFALTAAVMLMAAPAFATDATEEAVLTASGDAAAGEEQFNRQCVACHVVKDEAGETLAGRNARTGPNLYAIAGKPKGSVEGFRYSKSLAALGEEMGLAWDEASFVAYVQDPTAYLKEVLDDSKARGKMAFKVRDEQDAINLYAYLYSLAPPATEEGDAAATN
ncbi:c-type cytochrome [Roseovarius sp. LXJ103]|uniref:c-type cytochrome n=1 Tax=Roseovarius carneus TaxID=2853164 RepID=UPI000D60391B|nr:c-type cytochrome [Roseovarius carneus]MBZ8119158.1 c-type cytochrome [Roseovarius carneus]PWE35209.1 cytochrome C [Pelagicola sp. LXJ1103]